MWLSEKLARITSGPFITIGLSRLYSPSIDAEHLAFIVGARVKGRPSRLVIIKSKVNNMAKFVIYRDVAGQYRWRLVANNGEKVAASEAYVSRQGALNSAQRVKILAASATIVDNTTSELVRRLLNR